MKIVLTLVLLDHQLSYLHVLQCSHHSSSFFTIVFISFSPGDPLALGPLPLGYPNGKYNNNNNNNNTQCRTCIQEFNIRCSIHDFPYNKLNKNSLLQAAATIRERHMFRHAVAKVQILFESDFYSRAAFVQGRLLYKTLRYLFSSCFRATRNKIGLH